MDFFTQQDKARRYTSLLVTYFVIVVVLIVIVVNLVTYYFFLFIEAYPYTPQAWFSQGPVYYISAAVLLLIVAGSVYRWLRLRSGGHAVAAMVGAQRLALNTPDQKQRKLINVVEEMSIASGVPLPTLYVMHNEPAINAFVAGYEPTQAVMVVTEGAIEKLDRNELQGVVAHEFSHILNGDMRINVKLISVLAGILVIAVTGRLLVRGSGSGPRSSRDRSSGALVVFGLLLMLVGYIGVFGGRLIKAAVSRQREFLADAAAVQFTRQPRGIASALNKIRQSGSGSLLNNEHAEDMSHMCFSRSVSQKLSGWMATHPPLKERIQRIDPSFLRLSRTQSLPGAIDEAAVDSVVSSASPMPEQVSALAPMSGAQFTESVGQVDEAHIAYAGRMHEAMGEALLMAAHEKQSAGWLVLALVLVKMQRETGVACLSEKMTPAEVKQVERLADELARLDDRYRLPLLDILSPSLRLMSGEEASTLLTVCEALIRCDQRYTLQEFVLLNLVRHQLSTSTGRDTRAVYFSFRDLLEEVHLLLSLVVRIDADTEEQMLKNYYQVASGFGLQDRAILEASVMSPAKIQQALSRLGQLTPMLKKNIILACADLVLHDHQVSVREGELLRMIAESLDCPVPPLIPA